MRSILIMAAMLPALVQAQIFKDVSLERVSALRGEEVRTVGLSGDGRYALVTGMSGKGLVRVSLQDGARTVLSMDEGAGIDPVISDDGRVVLHCCDTFGTDRLRRTSLKVTDIGEGRTEVLMPPVRDINGYRFVGSYAEAAAEGGLQRRRVGAAGRVSDSGRPSVMSRDLRIQVTRGDETVTLTPNGDDDDTSYLWASLSPDGQRIAYYVSGEGTYVCSIDGTDVQYVSYECLAPQWYDDNTIVGMTNRDDGLYITASSIVAYTLDGASQRLTDPSLLLMYPRCSSQSGRIVCSSARGEMYMLEVDKFNDGEDRR